MLTLDAQWLNAQNLSPVADIRGAVGLSGPYDFLPLNTRELREIFAAANPLSSSQPIQYVTGHAPPMLLLTGGSDHTVDPGNTHRLAHRIRAMGGSVQEKTYPGIDHKEIIGAFARPLRFLAPSLADTLRFMHVSKDRT
jgi:acetyl esterase/lipase